MHLFLAFERSRIVDLRDLLIAAILGFVEGMTEFLPISSTGHMIIIDDLLLQSHLVLASQELANTFKVVIQFGSIIAVVIIFWDRLLSLLKQALAKRNHKEKEKQLTLTHIIIGIFPAILLGLLLEGFIDRYLFRMETVIIGLLFGAILMLLADHTAKEQHGNKLSLDHISYKQAVLIGLYQCLSLWPGFSRSGATISGGVLLGLQYRAAADFTFIMAIPIMLGASILSLYKKWHFMSSEVILFFITGFISAFIFAFLSIRFFLMLINQIKLKPFAIYRILLAIVLMLIYFYII